MLNDLYTYKSTIMGDISAKKRKKTQAENVEQFVYNFGINTPPIEKVILNLE